MRRADRVALHVITDGCCDRRLLQLCRLERRAVYAGCLDYAMRRRSPKAAGFAANLFKDIFGTWPQPRDRGPPAPLPDRLIDEWVADRKKTTARHQDREARRC
jgi:hypothetical protein